MRPAAPPCCITFLAPHTPHVSMILGFLCGHTGEISPNIQVVAVCACVSPNYFSGQPLSLHKTGGLSDDSPPVLCHLSYDSCLS